MPHKSRPRPPHKRLDRGNRAFNELRSAPATFIGERQPSYRIEQALKQVEIAGGGRGSIVEALYHSPMELAEDQQRLLNMLADPDNDGRSLAKVCADAGLKVKALLDLLRTARGARAYYEAINRVYDKLPDVAGDVMDRAVPHHLPCTACNGTGTTRTKAGGKLTTCVPCNGKGTFLELPDLERQKVALTIGGLLKPEKGGTTLNVNQQQVLQAGFFTSEDLKTFQTRSDKALFGERRAPEEPAVVDVEPVK